MLFYGLNSMEMDKEARVQFVINTLKELYPTIPILLIIKIPIHY